MFRRCFSWVFAAFLCSVAAMASAQTNVGVLEFDGTGVSKEFLAEGSKAIRETIVGPRFESKYKVSSGDKLSKLIVLLNCNNTDTTCLKKIADGLKATTLIYGEVKQPQKGVYDIELTMFKVEGQSSTSVRQKGLTASQFAPVAASLASEMLGVAPLAYLDIQANVPTAEVLIDGVKQTQALPMRVELAPGKHKITVSAPTYTTAEQEVELVVGSPQSIAVALSKAGQSLDQKVPPLAKALQWGGAGSVVVGLGLGVLYFVGFSGANDLVNANGTFDQAATGLSAAQEKEVFRLLEEKGVNTAELRVCDRELKATVGEVSADAQQQFNNACRFEALGIPGAVLAVGGGVALWYGIRVERDALKGKKPKEKVSVIPYFDAQNVGVSARLRW
jgi:PEGA domain